MLSAPTTIQDAAGELLYRRHVRAHLVEWCRMCGFEPAEHHLLLIKYLEEIARGENDRLAVFMPPGSAKSTYASVLFPGWYLAGGTERRSIITASHTGELAEKFGRRVRNHLQEHGKRLGVIISGDNKAAGRWETQNGSEYYAAGVGGAITGHRADLAIIDDPIRTRADADSQTIRDKQWEWFKFDLKTRLKPGGAIIVIQTRWHEDDLSGRILEDEADRWKIVRLPMEAEENDPLGRAPGEPLWPQWFTTEMREEAKRDPRLWSALYQQRPAPTSGIVFKVDELQFVDEAPRTIRMVRGWDFAATSEGGDHTVGTLIGMTEDNRTVVLDVVRFQGGPEEVEKRVVTTAQLDGRRVKISIPQDPGQAGKAHVLYMTRALAGFAVHSSPETGDKVTRAEPFAAQVNIRNVIVVRGDWNREFVNELRNFPAGKFDDQVDSASRSFNLLFEKRSPMVISDNLIRMMGRR